jgi:surface antigen
MMNKFLCVGTLVAGLAVAMSAFAQTPAYQPAPADIGSCRAVEGQATIDGKTQQTVGRACLQSDGTWKFAQDPDGSVLTYETAAYPYSDPWYYGPPLLIDGSFIFIDGFHHNHYFDHFRQIDHSRFGHGHFDGRIRTGFHGAGNGFGGMHRR